MGQPGEGEPEIQPGTIHFFRRMKFKCSDQTIGKIFLRRKQKGIPTPNLAVELGPRPDDLVLRLEVVSDWDMVWIVLSSASIDYEVGVGINLIILLFILHTV